MHCHKAQCCSTVCPSAHFSSLHTWSLELNYGDLEVLGHLFCQSTSPRLLSLARRPVLGRVLIVTNSHLKIIEAIVLLGTFNATEFFFCSLPQICAPTQSCFWVLQAVHLTSWLCFCSDMHFQLSELKWTDVCLSKSSNWIWHRFTPINVKHLKDYSDK